ncbi:MAG: hypothetical protein IT235_01440 [Bacteroidia bacterium]|nr:hypothetical protein [Bacteroidia bacterium]
MSTSARIKQCIDNHDEYVKLLATMSDKKLAKKLETIHMQMALAEKQRNTESLELLEIWRLQTIEARIYKDEHNIPDVPSEIELALAKMEQDEEKTEKRKEVFTSTKQIETEPETENWTKEEEKPKYNNDSQLTLF